jgi:hypothetical protein
MVKAYIVTLGIVLGTAGCSSGERIGKLEKQVEDLKAEVEKNQPATDFDLQGKCAKDSRVWFNENWSRDKDTILLTYSNHYNKVANSCLILVEYHYKLDVNSSWALDMSLWNVYENSKYADFSENHMIAFKPKVGTSQEVNSCIVSGTKCATIEQFNAAVQPYLNN